VWHWLEGHKSGISQKNCKKNIMHPLLDNLKNLSFEELDRRNNDILKKMQIMRRSGITTPEIWDQLHTLADTIMDEKMERAVRLNDTTSTDPVVINTDPLDDDASTEPTRRPPRQFTPVS
jgi:hypothetical protein